jgi:hypothetical protein
MFRLLNTVAFRFAIGYGALVVGAVALISAVLYFGTIGVLDRGINAKLSAVSKRLTKHFETRGSAALQREIEELLTDGIDQDTEVMAIVDRPYRDETALSDFPSNKLLGYFHCVPPGRIRAQRHPRAQTAHTPDAALRLRPVRISVKDAVQHRQDEER